MRQRLVYALALLWGASLTGSANADVLVKLECGREPFPSCDTLKQELVSGRPSEASLPADKRVPSLRKIADELVEGIHAGKFGTEDLGRAPFCPPLENSINGCKDESKTNSKEQSCGSLLVLHHDGAGKAGSALGRSNGTRETANIVGSLVVILADQYEKLKSQVAQNALSVSSGSACAPMANDLKKLIDAQKQTSNLEKLSSCDPKKMDECAAYQFFKSSTETIRAAYHMINRCLLVESTAREYRSFKTTINAEIKRNTMDNCAANNPDNAALNSCYASKYDTWFKSMLRSKYAQATNGC